MVDLGDKLQQLESVLQCQSRNEQLQQEYKKAKGKLVELQHYEIENLKQRAHIQWFAKGDQGSTFLSRSIKSRNVKNTITK